MIQDTPTRGWRKPGSGILLAGLALVALTLGGCKSKQERAIEKAKDVAVKTGQTQELVTTDAHGNTVITVVQPPADGQKGPVVTTTVTPPTPSVPAKGAQSTPPAGSEASSGVASADKSAAANTPPAPAPQLEITAGTPLVIRIDQRLSAKGSRPGQRFTGELAEAVLDSNGNKVIPRGAPVQGVVELAKGRGNFKGAATLDLRLTGLTLNGMTYPLDTRDVRRVKAGKGKRTGAFVGGGSGLGLLIGGIAGGGKGALIGGLAGAGAGTAGAGLTGNRDLVLPAESIVHFRLKDDLEIQR